MPKSYCRVVCAGAQRDRLAGVAAMRWSSHSLARALRATGADISQSTVNRDIRAGKIPARCHLCDQGDGEHPRHQHRVDDATVKDLYPLAWKWAHQQEHSQAA
jgi:hypothetical protein